jgi:hypothetical protein
VSLFAFRQRDELFACSRLPISHIELGFLFSAIISIAFATLVIVFASMTTLPFRSFWALPHCVSGACAGST